MLQVMLEPGILAQTDVRTGRATPGTFSQPSPGLPNMKSEAWPPPDKYVAIAYRKRWFSIGEDNIRSKSIFTSKMPLFSSSNVGVRTVPACRHRARQLRDGSSPDNTGGTCESVERIEQE